MSQNLQVRIYKKDAFQGQHYLLFSLPQSILTQLFSGLFLNWGFLKLLALLSACFVLIDCLTYYST
jgi:hypothetical protein